MKTLIATSILLIGSLVAFLLLAHIVPVWAAYNLLGLASITFGLWCNKLFSLLFDRKQKELNVDDFPHLNNERDDQAVLEQPTLMEERPDVLLTHEDESDELTASSLDEIDEELNEESYTL